ncbi:hypothetical protein HVTV-2_gp97 [Haloarcula virus HVTV-2]|uniref:Uncharacterized protein n=1 Tax=Haloarcula vallismortis tailed virus 1 TaxID=1262528 RepID=L7THZ7_9CAUD|nr:hypothetical protein HVTV1_97 [Haloarcula vallismortis tailed virus 1]AGC34466.1 hypothetical protein HVTV1_97 [Haloarcula vallismortis tailed virus 1]UBF22904.1 hypothetical protein HVTV-2_gp97 [Haloarcula virus HVTV-2]
MEHIEIIRSPMNEREVGVAYLDRQKVEIKAYGDTLPEAFENLARIMRENDEYDHSETESF